MITENNERYWGRSGGGGSGGSGGGSGGGGGGSNGISLTRLWYVYLHICVSLPGEEN